MCCSGRAETGTANAEAIGAAKPRGLILKEKCNLTVEVKTAC
jgi:hypothetical protein